MLVSKIFSPLRSFFTGSRPVQTKRVLDGVYNSVRKDGTKVAKHYKNGQLLKTETEVAKPHYTMRTMHIHGADKDSFLMRTEYVYNNALDDIYKTKEVFMTAVNYRMPNGQIVNGDFGRRTYYSHIDDKITGRNLYNRSWFPAFKKDADGTIHVRNVSHGWFYPLIFQRGKNNYL